MFYTTFSSESVCAGHPDKICDQISDAVLDSALKHDPYSHAGIECLVTTNQVIIAGEIKTKANINYEKIVKKLLKKLEYDSPIYQFDYHTIDIKVLVHQQSSDIAQGVDSGGAGDQGMMFGYACNETKTLMPLPIMLAHALTKKMDQLQKKDLTYLRPDGKSQVVIDYKNNQPHQVKKIILAKPHDPKINIKQVKKDLYNHAILPVIQKYKINKVSLDDVILNGTGKWEIGGPYSDMGETGRKIVVDSYGGMARVGGGCFSGKCPTKVDRSGAYGARYVAKNIVANNLADRCEVQVAYVIGKKKPIAYAINTFGTQKKKESVIKDFAKNLLSMSVPDILQTLDLRQPIYQKTATYGHFGRPEFPWEKIKG
ncbi:MAG: methionine adenosyltransferase [Candidatus Beckwithbacteria bacterium]